VDIEQMRRNFPPGVTVPDELERLCKYSEESGGDLSCDFQLVEWGRKPALAGSADLGEPANQFVIFGADSTHSLYGYWLYEGQGVEEAPIVYVNSEGCDCTVLANTLREFFVLLALGESLLGAIDGWGAWDEECEGIFEFRSWLKGEFDINPPSEEEARAIVERGRAAHPDLDAWALVWAERYLSEKSG
jgi:hypothetical protein